MLRRIRLSRFKIPDEHLIKSLPKRSHFFIKMFGIYFNYLIISFLSTSQTDHTAYSFLPNSKSNSQTVHPEDTLLLKLHYPSVLFRNQHNTEMLDYDHKQPHNKNL